MTDYEKRNFSIPKGLSREMNEFADENDMTYSELVRRAIDEYMSRDRLRSVEDKLDYLIEQTEEGDTNVRADFAENKNSETGNSTPDSDGAPDEITADTDADELPDSLKGNGYSVEEKTAAIALHASDGRNAVEDEDIQKSLRSIWGDSDPSDQTISKYTEKAGEWLVDNGWSHAPVVDIWFRDEETHQNVVRNEFDKREKALKKASMDDDPEEIRNTKHEAARIGTTAIKAGVVDSDKVDEVITKAKSVEQKARKNSEKDGRRGGGEKQKNLKNAAFR